MLLLYRFVSLIFPLVFKIGSLWSTKMKKGIQGRRNTFSSLCKISKDKSTVIWFHCASLGEYEQAKPLIELWKKKQTDSFIAVTFFSPSGYEQSFKNKEADWMGYLPFDSHDNASKFIKLLNPSVAIFVKYEFWYFYISEISKCKIPLFLISARFNKKQLILKYPLKLFYLNMLSKFTQLFLQDQESEKTCADFGLRNHSYSGDTRIDRVIANKEVYFDDKSIALFCKNHFVLILGSSWNEEEQIGLEILAKTDVKIIIAPHETIRSKDVYDKYIKFLPVLHTESKNEDLIRNRVLIINHIGILSKIYRYGNAALVGGGFSGKLHNVLEPVVYGIPVIFGPKFQKFPEAFQLIQDGLGHTINDADSLITLINQFQKQNFKFHYASLSENWFTKHQGVSERIYYKMLELNT